MADFFKIFCIILAFLAAVLAGVAAFQGKCSRFGDLPQREGEAAPAGEACTCMGYELYTIDEAKRGGPSESICIGYITSKSYRSAEPPAQPAQ